MKHFFRHYTFVDYATQAYILFVGILIAVFHNGTVPAWPQRLGTHAAGLLLVHLLILSNAAPRLSLLPPALCRFIGFLRHFYPVLFYVWLFTETGVLNRMFVPDYLDPVIIRCEQWLFGSQPSILFMQRVPQLVVSELFYASYFSYYLMISGVGIALYLRNRQQFFHYVSVISFVFYVCYTIYIFLPVVGPRVFFQDIAGFTLPEALQRLAPHPVYPAEVTRGLFYKLMAWIYRTFEASPGAAFPSSHVAIALTTLYFSFRYLSAISKVHLLLVVLLCGSTVYCRYHYAIDVMAGCLTALFLLPTGNWLYWKFCEIRPSPDCHERPALVGRG